MKEEEEDLNERQWI